MRLPALQTQDQARAKKQAMAFNNAPSDTESLKRLDEIVARTFRLHDAHRELIAKYLDDCHRRSIKGAAEAAVAGRPKTLDHSQAFEPVRLSEYEHLHRDRADLQQLVTFAPNKALPVHRWYKYTQGFSGQLVSHLVDELGVGPKDVVLDPFGGSGTTYVAAELTGRRWIGSELDCSSIIKRFDDLDGDRKHLTEIHANKNVLFKRSDLAVRRKNGRPLSKNYRLPESNVAAVCTDPAHRQVEMF